LIAKVKEKKMANKKISLRILVMALLIGTLFMSCEINIGDHDDEEDLVLDSGYAWVRHDVDVSFDWDYVFEIDIDVDDESYGFIFHENGYVDFVEEDNHGDWDIVKSVKFSVDDDDVKIGKQWFDFDVEDHDGLWLDDEYFEKEWIGNI
jgi:hypothetical protein